jgi:hypothetical protein
MSSALRSPILWLRVGIFLALIGASSCCAFEVLVTGIAYGDMYGVKEVAHQAALLRDRGQQYFLACVLLQGLSTIILAPLFLLRMHAVTRYLLALGASVIGTGIGFGLLVLILK